MKILKLFLLTLLIPLCSASCEKTSDPSPLIKLPKDTGGSHTAHYLGEGDNPFGYFAYLPSGYDENKYEYPVLVFLHGAGEKGNSQLDHAALNKVIVNGPPKLIRNNQWNPPYPMIVISPQCHHANWNPDKLHEFFEYLSNHYRIDARYFYLTGLSMGGFGTFSYLEKYADDNRIAAAIPICGGGNVSQAKNIKAPVWAFHGDKDEVVFPIRSIEMINAINANKPKVKAKLTMYPGIEHDSWSITYNNSGMGTESNEYDAFKENIYEWLFKYSNK